MAGAAIDELEAAPEGFAPVFIRFAMDGFPLPGPDEGEGPLDGIRADGIVHFALQMAADPLDVAHEQGRVLKDLVVDALED